MAEQFGEHVLGVNTELDFLRGHTVGVEKRGGRRVRISDQTVRPGLVDEELPSSFD